MNKRSLSNLIIFFALILLILFYRLVLVVKFLKYAEVLFASILLVILALAILLLGFQTNKKTKLKSSVMMVTATQIAFYFAITYGLGIVVGFLKNSYSLSFFSIIDNIFAPFIMLLCMELLRYVIISSNKDKKSIPFLVTIFFIAVDLALSINIRGSLAANDIFKILTLTILPAIVKNATLSYLTYHVGYGPAILYRLIVDLSVFVIPISPDLGDYLKSIISVALPFLIFLYNSRIINEYYKGVEHEFNKHSFRLIDIPFIIFFVGLICLVSGFFPYHMIGVGSGSMTPQINKGDAVIIHKLKNNTALEKGTIIAFRNENKTIVHRIVGIEMVGGVIYYHTKGDFNNTEDNLALTRDDIIGTVSARIPYIGYPAVYISEVLERN